MNSLRARLLLWLLPVTFVVAALASVGSYWGAALSLAGLLDEQLRYVAEHVNAQGQHLAVDQTNEPRRRLTDERADEVLTEVWVGPRLAFTSNPAWRLPPPEGFGLQDVVAAGQEWHTFVARRGQRLIRVAQAKDARWEALARVAVNLLWPIVALLPVLGACLWFGIGHGLRPLRQIASELSHRDASGWAPIAPQPLPEEVKPLVDALNGMLQRLERAFDAQGEFIADAAHELRTPTMALGVHAELAQTAIDADERDAALMQVRRGVQRLDRLARQLLALARVAPNASSPTREAVDLPALCRSVIVDELPSADARQQELGLDAQTPCVVRGDPVKLQLLTRNLVDNAIRYSPRDGRIDVAVRRQTGGIALEVEDTGPGIPAAERQRVLDRFYRGGDQLEFGSGLGLAIVKRIADEHHAALTLGDASAHRGLKVTVFFPD
jgi:signal transduction histidine kinase